MASDGRKSLMLDKGQHAHIMQLADTFNVSQPEIVEALLKTADKSRLAAALVEIARSREASAKEQREKAALLQRATAGKSSEELEKLLQQLGAL